MAQPGTGRPDMKLHMIGHAAWTDGDCGLVEQFQGAQAALVSGEQTWTASGSAVAAP